MEDYLQDNTLLHVFKLLPEFGPHTRLVFEYAELWGITGPPLKAKKLLRILTEVLEMMKASGFDSNRRRYEISQDGIAAALRMVCNQNLKGKLNSHGYLQKIMIGISREQTKERSKDEEHKLRDREAALGGEREKPAGDMHGKIKEFIKNIG